MLTSKQKRGETAASDLEFSRRERQIMSILFSLGRATGKEIQENLPDKPGYSGVRTILQVLERKGHVRHFEEGLRYVWEPVVTPETARKSAIDRLVATFFDGSVKAAAAAFFNPATARLTADDLAELEKMIQTARKEAK